MLGASLRRACGIARPPMTGLVVVIVAWWLLIGATVALTLPEPAASAQPTPFAVAVGRSAHLHQTGMPSWPIPIERDRFLGRHPVFLMIAALAGPFSRNQVRFSREGATTGPGRTGH